MFLLSFPHLVFFCCPSFSVVLLLSMLCMSVSTQPVIDQRRFSIAVSKVQHLHLLAQKYFSDFVSVHILLPFILH